MADRKKFSQDKAYPVMPLQPHFQGAKGEARFSEICANAGLICNKATQDFGGWDYLVDFEVPASDQPLDERRGAMTGRVQVKTLQAHRTRIEIRLSAAERLAKDPNPAFICVLKIDDALDVTDVYFMHINAERMSAILKRLRLEHSLDRSADEINKKYISFTLKPKDRIDCTAGALRNAWLAATGHDLYAYISMKEQLCKRLGYEGRPLAMIFQTKVVDSEEMVDAFLGLRSFDISEMVITKIRFGIPLVERKHEKGVVTVSPAACDACRILYQHPELPDPIVFESEVFAPGIPGLPTDKLKFHIRNKFFSVFLKAGSYAIHFNENVEKASLEAWHSYSLFRSKLADGKGTINLHLRSGRMQGVSLPTPTKSEMLSPYHEGISILCADLASLFKKAGIAASDEVSIRDVIASEEMISCMLSSIQGEAPQIRFRTTESPDKEFLDLIFPMFVMLGNRTIASYGIMRFSITGGEEGAWWETVAYRHIDVRDIATGSEEDFISAAMASENSTSVLRYDWRETAKVRDTED